MKAVLEKGLGFFVKKNARNKLIPFFTSNGRDGGGQCPPREKLRGERYRSSGL
ncbi:hypothetical protein O53_4347 [Microcystis aeruginosa TAIHU98]|uniref:Uncharacterized protein n=2 Tax=Microcystis aeruginosa TaxID=1126 RepID=A0A0A1VWA3_MICAE|nr:hypothetical protein O53_4347 [Microcystis aeruginosa TAIHU98]GAL93551.1 hypothetical protein N44_02238 [Microcystis aeruginosa NIES-44]